MLGRLFFVYLSCVFVRYFAYWFAFSLLCTEMWAKIWVLMRFDWWPLKSSASLTSATLRIGAKRVRSMNDTSNCLIHYVLRMRRSNSSRCMLTHCSTLFSSQFLIELWRNSIVIHNFYGNWWVLNWKLTQK